MVNSEESFGLSERGNTKKNNGIGEVCGGVDLDLDLDLDLWIFLEFGGFLALK